MEKIKKFINDFFTIEAEAKTARLKPNLEDYNSKLDKMNLYCASNLYNSFGLIHKSTLDSEDFYEDYSDAPPAKPRNLFKISEYKNDKLGLIYAVYCSLPNPIPNQYIYYNCFIVAYYDEQLKLIKDYRYTSDLDVSDEKTWIEGDGLEDLKINNLGELIRLERILEPKNDEESMKDYLEDK